MGGTSKFETTLKAEQIERILHSHVFQGSETLSRLLRYLAEKHAEDPAVGIKEYQIATEACGRKDDFDPRTDSTIRVQMARLRSKLIEYFATQGANDPIMVEIPKGTYRLSYLRHDLHHLEEQRSESLAHSPDVGAPSAAQTIAEASPEERHLLGWRFAAILFGALLLGSIAAIVFILVSARSQQAALASSGSVDPVVRLFWNPFLSGAEDPWVIFSNAAFIGKPDKGMRYYRRHVDPPQEVLDHYTGVGEVLSVHELDQVLYNLGKRARVKRGALVSLDDVKDTNLIFVGAPVENLTLNDIPTTRDFKFEVVAGGPREGDVIVVNHRPLPGELPMYINAPDKPISDDYAVIALFPGMNPRRSVLLAAGTTTVGTQAAVEYICHANTLSVLMQRLGSDGVSKPFEVVLHIRVAHGVPVSSEIVTVHKITTNN